MDYRLCRFTKRTLIIMEDILAILGIAIITLIMLAVVQQVVSRYLFNWVQPAHIEIVELLMPGAVFLALAYTQRSGHQIRVDILVSRFGGYKRLAFDIIALALMVSCCIFLTYTSWVYAFDALQMRDVTTNTYIITWPSKMIVPVGFVLISIRGLVQIVQLFIPRGEVNVNRKESGA